MNGVRLHMNKMRPIAALAAGALAAAGLAACGGGDSGGSGSGPGYNAAVDKVINQRPDELPIGSAKN